jgi:hypothetical protein
MNKRTIFASMAYTLPLLIVSLVCTFASDHAFAFNANIEKPALLPLSSAPLEWSTHAEEDAAHQHLRGLTRPRTPLELGEGAKQGFPLAKTGSNLIVYGYLPYWEFEAEIPWTEITHLGYFSVGGSATGAVSNDYGWGESEQLALLEEAHSHGVRMDLVVTLFSESALQSVLSSPSKRAVFASNLTELAVQGQADGINLDFEGMPASVKEDLVSFVLELSASLWEVLPDAEISLATPAVDWSGAYDYDLLAASTDFLFIMCYGYHWSGGSPGPNAPINSDGPWSHKSISWTIDDYIEWGGGESVLDKIVIGLPSYGHNWPTTSSNIPGTATSKASAKSYRNLKNNIGFENFTVEPESGEKYYFYEVGAQWHQIFADDGETTATKVAWVLERGVRGYGFWALGYDANDPDYWEPLRASVHATLGYPDIVEPGPDAGGVAQDAGTLDAEDPGVDEGPVNSKDTSFSDFESVEEVSATDLGISVQDTGSNEDLGPTDVVRESGGCSAGKNANKTGWVFLLIMLSLYPWMRYRTDQQRWAKRQVEKM